MWGAVGSVGNIFVAAALLLYGQRSFAWTERDLGCGASSVRDVGLEWFEPFSVVQSGPERVGLRCILVLIVRRG